MVDHSKFSNYEIKLKRDVKSFVWEHFGDLQDKSTGKIVDTNNVYCLPCFSIGAGVDKKPVLKLYKASVSTNYLATHQREVHNIVRQVNQPVTNHSIKSIFAVVQNKKNMFCRLARTTKNIYLAGN